MSITHLRQVVQVKKLRQHGYATVDLINRDGSIKKRDQSVVVRFPELGRGAVTAGSLWEVSGQERQSAFKVNEFTITEYTIDADSIRYLRPSGRILARWISANVPGIGAVIANRLVRVKELDRLIETRDMAALLQVAGMTETRAERLIQHWPDEALYDTIEWLEARQLPLGLGDKLVTLFGAEAIEKVKAHPFLLMAMGVSFEKTLEVARALELSMSDDCVMAGVAQHVAVTESIKTGSTVISSSDMVRGCSAVMKHEAPPHVGDLGVEYGLLVKVDAGYQVYGTALMESEVARRLAHAHNRARGAGPVDAAWEYGATPPSVTRALADYEATLGFTLTDEQREAVVGAVLSPVVAISGGAGTGKTTILRAILGVYEAIAGDLPCYQVALSGRAAQRMAESTGRPARTIAKLIAEHIGERAVPFPSHALIIIDEASMVDLLSMYRLTGILPPATRYLFVGDAAQLPPVGAGLVFHALIDTPIPCFHLSQVKRQSEESGIHRLATSVRQGALELPPSTQRTLAKSADCSLESNATSMARLIELWHEAGGIERSIVLSPVRKGELGVNNINAMFQSSVGLDRAALHYVDDNRGWIPWVTSTGTQLREGDPILVTANHYEEGVDIRNGDLAILVRVVDEPDGSGVLGVMEIDGTPIFLTRNLLESLDLGYAVTIHKAQGSQWECCFIALPGDALRMIDQTLIYTAVTRAQNQLVLLGDKRVIEQGVERGSIALSRRTGLRERVLSLV